ncbi:hypothetical protein [Methanocella sp. MCL-LM]|uniref:hypothetical protein n=1 Tax=Methanocella sp. MCL-LM TaxID=3412035 RepID=UPI003C719CD3
MDDQYQSALALLQPYITDQAGVNVLSYPGTREEFSDNLINLGAQACLIRFALRFEGRLIDLDLLFYIVDIIHTTDGAVIFYSPESRVLDLKMITRPH